MQLKAATLFDTPAKLYFEPEQTHCPIDNEPLRVCKTNERTVKALGIGEFKAQQTIRYCKHHAELGLIKSTELAELVPANSNVSYSVIAEIGKLRYLHHRQVKEIADILFMNHAIHISTSEIELLIDKFVFYLSFVHQESVDLIRRQIEARGGYILHLDGTCEGDSPKLLSSVDSVSGFVLYTAKVQSENTSELSAFLENIKTCFGKPLAVVSDMGKGIQAAVSTVFGDMPHYICHFHFMAAIGNMLFEKEHKALYKSLSNAGISGKLKAIRREMPTSFNEFSSDEIETYITNPDRLGQTKEATDMLVYCLVLWILDHPSDGNGYGFPFDQRYLNFYERLTAAYALLDTVKNFYPTTSHNDDNVWKLFHLIKTALNDSTLKATVANYTTKLTIFTELRHALGVAPESTTQGLRQCSRNDSARELRKIRTAVDSFMIGLEARIQKTTDPSIQTSFEKVRDRVLLHYDRLLADPIEIEVNHEKRIFFIHRTNNIMEQQFRSLAYSYRRVHGNRSIRRNLEHIPDALPLVINLKNPNYVKLVFEDISKIANRFAKVDVLKIRKMIAAHDRAKRKNASRKVNRLLRKPVVIDKIIDAFARVAKHKRE